MGVSLTAVNPRVSYVAFRKVRVCLARSGTVRCHASAHRFAGNRENSRSRRLTFGIRQSKTIMNTLILLLGLTTMAYAQLGRFTTQSYQPEQYYNPNYNPNYQGRPFYAILRQTQDSSPDGSYSYSYDTANGISVAETGQPKNIGPNQIEAVRGQYSYTAPDGTPILVTYTADENGFVATGAHLPTPPPIPVEIQRALAHNAAHPEEEEPYRRY